MIRYSIKISNDHRKASEDFESNTLNMDHANASLMERIQTVVDKFKTEVSEPVDKVKITATWEV